MVLIEETLNLLPRLGNALSQGSHLEYLLYAKLSSCCFHVSLQIALFPFFNYYFKTLDTSPTPKRIVVTLTTAPETTLFILPVQP